MRKRSQEAPVKTSPKKAAQRPPPVGPAVAASLGEIAATLGRLAYQVSEDSGDGTYYVREGLGGREKLWRDYWANQYRSVFFSAFYALEAGVQGQPAVQKCAREAFALSRKALRDKAACVAAYREQVPPTKRLAGLRLFDGKRSRVVKALPGADLTERSKADGFV